MNKNIYAYTEFKYKSYPSYISLNKIEGKYKLTVRATSSSNSQTIELSFIELLKLQSAISGLCSFDDPDD